MGRVPGSFKNSFTWPLHRGERLHVAQADSLDREAQRRHGRAFLVSRHRSLPEKTTPALFRFVGETEIEVQRRRFKKTKKQKRRASSCYSMDSAPRAALRDRSNDDELASKSLILGFIDQRAAKEKSRVSEGSGRSESPTAADDAATAGEAAATAAAAGATLPIVTPEPPHPDASTIPNSAADSAGALREAQRQDGGAARAATANTRSSSSSSSNRGGGSSQPAAAAVARPRPPPPVACTLVAFEPGSLGLELEAIVDEGARKASRGQDGHGGRPRRRGGGGSGSLRRPRRLGCRVFRVTPDGQAARHGSVHPGDALVVLDG